MDTIAATCASNDEAAIENLYTTEDLAVPETILI
jgi:hypothetical protein